jgi:uncharacterized protein YcbK (DUF882 family)
VSVGCDPMWRISAANALAFIVGLVAWLAASAGWAQPAASAPAAPRAPSGFIAKKDQDLADKRARAALSAAAGGLRPVTAIGRKPMPIINLLHRWTQETLAVDGTAPPAALQDRLLRDHYTNQSSKMAVKLVPTLVAAARYFRVARVEIVSGYRHPKYNLILRKKGHQVARDSEHSHGSAVDFRLAKIPTEQLFRWALAQRMGGVGIYLQSNFVHMDVGPIRRWSGE